MPDFLGLATKVVETLGVQRNSPAIALLEEARTIEGRTGVASLIPADRIFGILEREFLARDVEAAVATALRPNDTPDLSAHQTLLDLATTPDGEVRIVTTNFDRLFDECGRQLHSWQRPRLPDPSRPGDMNGIVYLHGKATADYRGAEGDGLVLSSAAFGRAYLADGWATSFLRNLIAEYVVLFVGYAADDPPVQYLLEALNMEATKRRGIYAFQAGGADDAASRWAHKGVEAIPYGDHPALWSTLHAWAARAQDPEQWYSDTIDTARRRPEELSPHERGQVAHVVSTADGLRRFATDDEPPPADWLCVFDPGVRCASPGPSGTWREPGPHVDPFAQYGIDSDVRPGTPDTRRHGPGEPPTGAWDGFACNDFDRQDSTDETPPCFRGMHASPARDLPRRLHYMGTWLGKIAAEPTTVWWAARQGALHPRICEHLRRSVRRSEPVRHAVREAWSYLFESWDQDIGDEDDRGYALETRIATEGWSGHIIRQYAAALRPHLIVSSGMWCRSSKPPEWPSVIARHELVHVEVVYPTPFVDDPEVPDEHLASIVAELRRNLEMAFALETEVGGWGLLSLEVDFPDASASQGSYNQKGGLAGLVNRLAGVFDRLCDVELDVAKREFSKWATDDAIFGRLRIWAGRKSDLVPDAVFGTMMLELSDSVFWGAAHQRELLLTIRARWDSLAGDSRTQIEKRMLGGRQQQKEETNGEFERRRARLILDRLAWLSRQGCDLVLDLEGVSKQLRGLAPKWSPEDADDAVRPLMGEGGFVSVRTEHSALLTEPLVSTLSKARELSGRRDDFLSEYDPYGGLASARPVRALSALSVAAKQGVFPGWAWTSFLTNDARQTDRPKFIALIAERLGRCPVDAIAEFLHGATMWLHNVGPVLAETYEAKFLALSSRLISVVVQFPGIAGYGASGGTQRDWAGEAINSPTGKLAEVLFYDPELCGRKASDGLPEAWVRCVGDCWRWRAICIGT